MVGASVCTFVEPDYPIRLQCSGLQHPQTLGKVERFHGSLQRALVRRELPRQKAQEWLDAYRWEYNHVRPHKALGMQTPATRWRPSPRRYDPPNRRAGNIPRAPGCKK